eukprot:COSAG02_NODE_7403_length_3033_cov_3.831970_1_plen_71_part_00
MVAIACIVSAYLIEIHKDSSMVHVPVFGLSELSGEFFWHNHLFSSISCILTQFQCEMYGLYWEFFDEFRD